MADIKKTLHVAGKVNLHTHSWYCGHGTGTLSEYVQAAQSLGFTALGLSEHCPVPDDRWRESRMPYSSIDTYMTECRQLQSRERGLQILCGFECDHDPRYVAWYRERLLENRFTDYIAFGVHHVDGPDGKETYAPKLPPTKQSLHTYTNRYVDALQSGNYLFGVHPDLFGVFYTRWDDEAASCSREILRCAKDMGIPLEINGYGLRKTPIHTETGPRQPYPLREFWELAAEEEVITIVNSDAHDPRDLDLRGVGAFELAAEMGITVSGWSVVQEGKNLTITPA